jgi:sulfide:quinone oxidoreductase
VVLFGVVAYVPVLESYIKKYEAQVNFTHNVVEIDGENKVAHFKNAGADREDVIVSS